MFFLFSEIIFHSQIIIGKSTYFKGGENKEMQEKLKKKEKRNENEKERRSLCCFWNHKKEILIINFVFQKLFLVLWLLLKNKAIQK